MSGRAERACGLAVLLTAPPMDPADAGVARSAVVACAPVVVSAPWTVSGEVVIVLLWN
jgi:hypothetical protein